jgi:hypothetical protein
MPIDLIKPYTVAIPFDFHARPGSTISPTSLTTGQIVGR